MFALFLLIWVATINFLLTDVSPCMAPNVKESSNNNKSCNSFDMWPQAISDPWGASKPQATSPPRPCKRSWTLTVATKTTTDILKYHNFRDEQVYLVLAGVLAPMLQLGVPPLHEGLLQTSIHHIIGPDGMPPGDLHLACQTHQAGLGARFSGWPEGWYSRTLLNLHLKL